MRLSEWMIREEEYQPGKDRDYFISRSFLRVLAVLVSFRHQAHKRIMDKVPARTVLILFVLWLFLTVSAHTPAFLLCQLAGILALLCLLDGRVIRQLLGTAVAAMSFSFFLLFPALFLGTGNRTLLMIPFKTFLTVSSLGIVTELLSWHQMTAALRAFRLPQEVIFLLDTALRCIVLLGERAGEMLTALKLRSVGHNPHKSRVAGGVLGSLFLYSRDMSEEMYQAMICRCFTGEYPAAPSRRAGWMDAALWAVFLVYLFLFLRMEGI